jgi:hypothetical protein
MIRRRCRVKWQQTREGYERSDLPSAGRDRVQRHDRTLRDANEGYMVQIVFEAFAFHHFQDQLVESLTDELDVIRPQLLSVQAEPLMTPLDSWKRRVRSGNSSARQCSSPGTDDRHHGGTASTHAM